MHFPLAALGFKDEAELREKIACLSENYGKEIMYVKEGILYQKYVEAYGVYDYYSIDGTIPLADLLCIKENLTKEEIFKRVFHIKSESQYITDVDYKLKNIYHIIINTPALQPFHANGIPGAVNHPAHIGRRDMPVIYIDCPVEVIEFPFHWSVEEDEGLTPLWDRLIPYYRVFNNVLYRKAPDVFILDCHC